MRAAILAIVRAEHSSAAAADDEVIDEAVITARYIASTIGHSPAPLIVTLFTIDVIDRELIHLRNVESVAERIDKLKARRPCSTATRRPVDWLTW